MTEEQKKRCVELLVAISRGMRKNARRYKLDREKDSKRYFQGVSFGLLDAAKIMRDFK